MNTSFRFISVSLFSVVTSLLMVDAAIAIPAQADLQPVNTEYANMAQQELSHTPFSGELQDYVPPDNGGPDSSQGSGTR